MSDAVVDPGACGIKVGGNDSTDGVVGTAGGGGFAVGTGTDVFGARVGASCIIENTGATVVSKTGGSEGERVGKGVGLRVETTDTTGLTVGSEESTCNGRSAGACVLNVREIVGRNEGVDTGSFVGFRIGLPVGLCCGGFVGRGVGLVWPGGEGDGAGGGAK